MQRPAVRAATAHSIPPPPHPMDTITLAGAAGRLAGTIARGMIWARTEIEWPEVGALVIDCMTALAVLTFLAGRACRRAWDALPVQSDRLGRWYAALLVPSPTAGHFEVGTKMVPETGGTERGNAASDVAQPRTGIIHISDPMARAVRMVHEGKSQRLAAARCGVPRSSLQRVLKA
jgi:hypothetical protein